MFQTMPSPVLCSAPSQKHKCSSIRPQSPPVSTIILTTEMHGQSDSVKRYVGQPTSSLIVQYERCPVHKRVNKKHSTPIKTLICFAHNKMLMLVLLASVTMLLPTYRYSRCSLRRTTITISITPRTRRTVITGNSWIRCKTRALSSTNLPPLHWPTSTSQQCEWPGTVWGGGRAVATLVASLFFPPLILLLGKTVIV